MSKSTIFNKSQTDWERLDTVDDENIDLSDIPELMPDMFANAIIKQGLKDKENKTQWTICVDQDVLTWFKSQGRGYQTRINSLLRAYMEANVSHKKSSSQQAQRQKHRFWSASCGHATCTRPSKEISGRVI